MADLKLERREYILTLAEPMLGTVPKDPKVYESYIASKAPQPVDDEIETVPVDLEAKGWTGFHSDATGIFVFDYLIKGFFKEVGNTLKEQAGIKNLRKKIDDFVFVTPRRIYIRDADGNPLRVVDGVVERPLRAMTMQGPRVTLARSDAVDAGRELRVMITLFDQKEISWETIELFLDYGAFKALGQFRNGGYGRIAWRAV